MELSVHKAWYKQKLQSVEKHYLSISQETIQLAQINNFQECTYSTDKYWPHFKLYFIDPATPEE